jgi:hypothetical protein
MRDANTFTESLFTLQKLGDFVPAKYPLRTIRMMVNNALAEMGELFAWLIAMMGAAPTLCISATCSVYVSGMSECAGPRQQRLRQSRENGHAGRPCLYEECSNHGSKLPVTSFEEAPN